MVKWPTYVPHDDGSRSPLDADLQVLRKGNVVVQEVEEGVGFLALVADDVLGDCVLSVMVSIEVGFGGTDTAGSRREPSLR